MNIEWAKGWIDSIGAGTLLGLYADDVQFEDVILGHKFNGKAELTQFFISLGGPDASKSTFSFDKYSGDAECGAIEWTWECQHGRDFLGVAAAGKQTTVRGVSLMTFHETHFGVSNNY